MNEPNKYKKTQDAVKKALDELKKEKANKTAQTSDKKRIDYLMSALQKTAENSKITKNEMKEIVKEIVSSVNLKVSEGNITLPEVKIPEIKIPKIELPDINVPRPEVTVNVPKASTPQVTVKPADVNFPDEMEVKGLSGFAKSLLTAIKKPFEVILKGVNRDNPVPVILTDNEGKFYTALANIVSSGGGGSKIVSLVGNTIKDGTGTEYSLLVDTSGHLQVDVLSGGGGTEYTEGDVDATITGLAAMAEGAANAVHPLQLDANKYLKVAEQGTVTVDGSGVTQPISAAALPLPADAATQTTLATIDADTSKLAGAVTGTEMQVDIVADGAGLATQATLATIDTDTGVIAGDTTSINGKITACNTGAVTISASLPAGTNAIGKLAANDAVDIGDVTINNAGGVEVVQNTAADLNVTEASAANALTALQIIDDWDAVHDSAASSDGVQLMGAYDSTKPTAVADGDAVRVLADAYGRLLAGKEPEAFQSTINSADATSATSVKAKTADKRIHILTLVVSTDTAMNIKFQDDAGTPAVLIQPLYFAANGGAVITFPPEAPLIVATNQDLDVIASAAGNISVAVTGYLAP